MTHETSLTQRVERRRAERAQIAAEAAYWNQGTTAIAEAPDLVFTDFWCDTCKTDFEAPGRKVVMQWEGEPFAFYRALRSCHPVRRFISYKPWDPYYGRSRLLKAQRGKLWRERLQPGDEGYDLAYGVV